MKLHLDTNTAINTVTAYDSESIEINRKRFAHAIILWPDRPVVAWPVTSVAQITLASFDGLAALKPEVVLVGTGAKQQFLHPRITSTLAAQYIGVEAMGTAAACRTYNILIGEGRRVVALLLPAS
jgi:uncharacterized protein